MVRRRLTLASGAVLALVLLAALAPAQQRGRRARRTPAPPATEETQPEDPVAEAQRKKDRLDEVERLETDYFRICDLDANRWISYRESEATLGLDRDEFKVYDRNADGRIDEGEFSERFRAIRARLGVLRAPTQEAYGIGNEYAPPPPLDRGVGIAPGYPAPGDILSAYDRDRNATLDAGELERLYRDLLGSDPPPDVLAALDSDASGSLDGDEIERLGRLIAERLPLLQAETERGTSALERELRLQTVPREQPPGAPPREPRIIGPATHFRRLDLHDDGFIDAADLQELLTPARLSVRLSAVVAALDRDGDGRLTRAELEGGFRH